MHGTAGDDAQSIYSFRGATIENTILPGLKDYDDVKKVVNHRELPQHKKHIGRYRNNRKRNKATDRKKTIYRQYGRRKDKTVRAPWATWTTEGKMVADAIQKQTCSLF
jgi:DNA helicase-2/ATP-dependent DNA helicase PcrA